MLSFTVDDEPIRFQSPKSARPNHDDSGRDPPWMANLTDTQKETLKQKMEELKTAGKARALLPNCSPSHLFFQ